MGEPKMSLIRLTWRKLKSSKVARAFLTAKILKGFTIRIGLPHKWAIKIAIWLWIRNKEE